MLQVVNTKTTSGFSTTAITDIALSNWTAVITKKQSNSTIVAFMSWYGYYATAPTWWSMKAYANGVGVTSASVGSGALDSAVKSHNQGQYTFLTGAHQHETAYFYDTTNSSTVTFTYFWRQVAAGTYYFWSGAPVTITYMGIAG